MICRIPLCEEIIEGDKIQLLEGLFRSPEFKGFIQEDVDITKAMVRLQRTEAEERTSIEMSSGSKAR